MTLSNPKTSDRPAPLNGARARVAQMRSALLNPTPEAIEECLPGLAEAADMLGRVQQDLAAGAERHNIFMDMQALRRELAELNQLIVRGAGFYGGWAKLLGAATGGYMASGEAAPVKPASKIFIRG
jgi:hypothetical protein